MFDLSLTPSQRSCLTPNDGLDDELRALAAAAEHDRKPSIELREMISAGRFPVPLADDGGPDPLAVVLAATRYAHADPGAALAIVGSWQSPLIEALTGGVPVDAGSLTPALLYEGFGRRPSEYTTTATRSGDGWIISGRKDPVLYPGEADQYLVVARQAGDGRLGAFVVPGGASGLIVERDDASEGKLGLRAAHTGVIRLDRVRVTDAARLMTTGDDLALHRAVALCRSTLAGVALGCARASLHYAIEWAKLRSAFGKLIASYQGVSFVLADLETAIDSAELLLWDTVTRLATVTEVDEFEGRVGRAIARATAVATDAGRQGVNLLGVHGIVTEHPVERWYRASAALSTIDFDPLNVALEVS